MIPFTFFMKRSKRNSADKHSLNNLIPKVIDLKSGTNAVLRYELYIDFDVT